jgi:DNA-binding MarR family transcriptional regulator
MTNKQAESIANLVGEVAQGCLLTRTRRISRVVTAIYDEALRPFGVKSPQFSLLVLIAKLKGASRSEIGRANHQERSTLTRNLASLLAEGWIEELVPEGGRRRPIVLTEAGQELLGSAANAWRSAHVKAGSLLGAQGVDAIVSTADRLPVEQVGA